ncbi:coproporphyrinogen-III oxidase family protein [Candidatus Thiothrix sp. Deng01]|uniref:Coproporphyrinogen-III oxidase family protein n=1 Tax=Candidatus Thiothrix phosphatis TaxID=3112415 RepID=A0ABU6CWN1_9GAMM|nr:coproporphyrinogen-III oxidase family protein [Candidatus Thiothrix sp. Deng01]MEB4591251.1 coproporphyrinogen-III oxidase family protein [Candidatus Thiothrix sp. Deng01]
MTINTRKEHDYWDPNRTGFVTNYPNFMQWRRMESGQMGTEGKPLNLYLHTPFCVQRCSYCYYKTTNLRGTDKNARMERYVNALCQEIKLAADHYQLGNRPINSIYFGGGTPSLLPEALLERVAQTLQDTFKLGHQPEFTLEAEPITLTPGKAELLKSLNVNRISMGVQSFDDGIIKGSNRSDSEKKALKAIEIAKQTGAVINIDLMSGLAGETMDTWRHSVGRALSTGVESITVYKTELYTNSTYYKQLRDQAIVLPTDEEELVYMQHAQDRLMEAGYQPWSFYTFTKNGENVHKHSPSIFRGDDCYAFGVSAFGRLGDWVFQNSNEEERYLQFIDEGQIPVQRGHFLTSQDNMTRDVVLTMKLVSLNLDNFQAKYGFRLEKLCADAIGELRNEGYIDVSEEEIRLTPKGVLHGDYSGKRIAQSLMRMYH